MSSYYENLKSGSFGTSFGSSNFSFPSQSAYMAADPRNLYNSNLDLTFKGSFLNSQENSSSQSGSQPGFFNQLGQNLKDPLQKAAYALGYKTTGGRFPTAQESGLFEEEPEEKDYSQSELSRGFLDKIIGEILDKREQEQSPILPLPNRPSQPSSFNAFGSGFNPL